MIGLDLEDSSDYSGQKKEVDTMKSTRSSSQQKTRAITSPFLVFILTFTWFGLAGDTAVAAGTGDTDSVKAGRVSQYKSLKDYTHARDWNLKAENLVPTGHNPLYFPFRPGFKFIMEKPDHPDGPFRKEIIVRDETEPFDLPGIGKFHAAVVQEDEFFEGRWTQRAINWFVIDKTNNSVYALGEITWEIDDEGNKVFEGTWRAGEPDGGGVDSPNAEPGLLMPGTFNLGARYIYDGSESESLGGTENMESGITITTPAGTFEDCVRVREQNLTYIDDVTDKVWCPGVGIVSDTSDGKLVASDILPDTDTSSFGKFHLAENKPQFDPPVAKISGQQATEIALKKVPGEATSVSIERKRRKNVYVVEILAKADGVETDVFVDIETGEVVGTDR
jgi:uncharacterized membrane protein YkoI